MNGIQHFHEAERLLDSVSQMPRPVPAHDLAAVHSRALVHATLAKAPAAPVDLSELRNLVRAFDPTSGSDRARAFKNDLLQVIVGIERGGR